MDGITLTLVGMLTVFVFLATLVLAMSLLRRLVARFAAPTPSTGEVAAIVAAVHAARVRRSEEEQSG